MASNGRLIVFDLDGTLVDSRLDIAAALNVGLTSVGASPRAPEELFPFIGRTLGDIYRALLNGAAGRAEGAAEAYRRHYYDHCTDQSTLYEGVAETLAALHGPYRTALATTKMTFMAERVVDLLGLRPWLDHVQGTDDFPAKPDGEVIRRVMKAITAKPEQMLMVGDTPGDIAAGRQVGVKTCAVTYGYRDREVLEAAKPDALIGRFDELPGVLDRLGF